MVEGLIGRKVGMTQVFDPLGVVIPCTVLEVGPCVVVQKRERTRDGYEAIQLGLVESRKAKGIGRAAEGHFKKANLPPTRYLREFRLLPGSGAPAVGDKVLVSLFKTQDWVDVIGHTKGKGFQGVMKRHGFRGGARSHGSMFHRAPGSIGQSAYPSRVFRGMRMPGQTGGGQVTIKNLEVVRVDEENNLLVVKGAVPGARGSLIKVRRSRRPVRAVRAEAPKSDKKKG